jgi:hypothetical protein
LRTKDDRSRQTRKNVRAFPESIELLLSPRASRFNLALSHKDVEQCLAISGLAPVAANSLIQTETANRKIT